MKLNTKVDVEAPLAFVNAALVDFEAWERAAMRRGAEVERLDSLANLAPGRHWRIAFQFRAKKREMEVKLRALEPMQSLSFEGTGKPAQGVLTIEMAEMGRNRTRVSAKIEVTPRTLAARLLLQSMRLAKAKITRRFTLQLAQIAADIEDRYNKQPKA